ncbi:MAG: hypothetical protein LBL87_00365 [Ruminococcus sp.]|jgi:hypothetical protein|nr:hypothetical protein [Ruminococcus sp.]
MEVSAEKISELLSDPESMKQINELADMLKEGLSQSDSQSNPQNADENPQSAEPDPQNGNDGEDLFGGLFDGVDFAQILQILSLISDPPKDKNVDFLSALKPLMSEEKQPKIERSIKLLKLYDMYEVLKEKGLLPSLDSIL